MRHIILAATMASVVALAPAGLMAGDRETAQEIATSLHESGKLKAYKIRVKFEDGTVWLSGHVTNQHQAKLAASHISAMPNVKRVVNRLKVSGNNRQQSRSQSAGRTNHSKNHATRTNPDVRTAAHAAANEHRTAQPATPIVPNGRGRVPQALAQMPPAQIPGGPVYEGPVAGGTAYQGPVNGGMVYGGQGGGGPLPAYVPGAPYPISPARYDQPYMPNHAWPSYAAYPNYAAVTYPKQYSPTAWPFIGPFYPYPQVPLGWRRVTLEWDDGWWMLDFKQR